MRYSAMTERLRTIGAIVCSTTLISKCERYLTHKNKQNHGSCGGVEAAQKVGKGPGGGRKWAGLSAGKRGTSPPERLICRKFSRFIAQLMQTTVAAA